MRLAEKIRVIAAPGPVSYPLIASKNKDIEIIFDKDSKEGDAIIDSTVSLIKRGLRINYSLIRRMTLIHPDFGKRIGIWRKGSANDILLQLSLSKLNKTAEVVYFDDMQSMLESMKKGEIDSSVLPVGLNRLNGIYFDDIIDNFPGNCGLHIINKDAEDVIISAYKKGIENIKNNPNEYSRYVASILPVSVNSEFVSNTILKAQVYPIKIENDINVFIKNIKKYI